MTFNYSKFTFLVKHLIVWIILILLLTISPLQWGWTISNSHSTLFPHIYGAITNAIIFYGTAFYLIPDFFNKNKKRRFWMYAILALFSITVVETVIDSYLGKFVYTDKVYALKALGKSASNQIATSEISLIDFITGGLIYTSIVNLFYFIIAFAYRFPIDKQLTAQREHQLIQEKLSAELKFLRAQVHPHTLFNGMNSIYHLIDKEPELAKETLLYLSNSLRYHLYDSQERFVSLDKEITYLREYIKLYQVRSQNEIKCTIDIEEFEDEYKIAPLLFTPFIENAFKYVSRYPDADKNTIEIQLKMNQDELEFSCTNTIDKFPLANNSNGIGLTNVSKRLQLIYEDLHTLEIQKNDYQHNVQLAIKLEL